jgi:hypothetical protein
LREGETFHKRVAATKQSEQSSESLKNRADYLDLTGLSPDAFTSEDDLSRLIRSLALNLIPGSDSRRRPEPEITFALARTPA